MAGIRGRNTRPEMTLRKALHRQGFRYRLHKPGLPGKPDLVLAKHRAAIFVHGCFWHRHEGCHWCSIPKTNVDFWNEKLGSNSQRDQRDIALLRKSGWRVAVVWECGLKTRTIDVIEDVSAWLQSDQPYFETEVVRPK